MAREDETAVERRVRAAILKELGELYADRLSRTQFKRFRFSPEDADIGEALLRRLAANYLIEYRDPCLARLTEAGYRLLAAEIGDTAGEPPVPDAQAPTREELDALAERIGGAEYFTQSIVRGGQIEMVWATPGFRRVTGYSLEELREAGGWPVILRDPDRIVQTFQGLLRGETIVAEIDIRTRNGAARRLRVVSEPRMDGDNLIGTIGAARDITDRK